MKIPAHIAIIMDGNGRWAKSRALPRVFGHRSGVKTSREVIQTCSDIGVKYLTLYVFSSENWHRPPLEVSFLMGLMVEMLNAEIESLHQNKVKIRAMGDLDKLPELTYKTLMDGIKKTENNTGLNLNLAVSYGGRQEIVRATRAIAEKVVKGEMSLEDITEQKFTDFLYLPDVPDPELMIRTGGEYRTSNYLLWQLAYSEFYITDVLWPDFNKAELDNAISFFNKRQRRFGRVLEE